jgi:hypothetical protein
MDWTPLLQATPGIDWWQIFQTTGVLGVIVVFGAWFLAKQVWPWFTKRVEAADARAAEMNSAMIKAMTDNAVINAQTARILEDMNRNIKELQNIRSKQG